MGLSDEIAKGLGLPVMMAVHQEELGSSNSPGRRRSRGRAGFSSTCTCSSTGSATRDIKSTAAAGLAHTLCVLGRFDEVEGYAFSEASELAADQPATTRPHLTRYGDAPRWRGCGPHAGTSLGPSNCRENRTRCSTSRRTRTTRAIFAGRGIATKRILTPRELHILGLLSEGRSNRSIAPSHW